MNESQPAAPGRCGLREAAVRRGAPVRFTFENRVVEAYEGELLAAALLAAGWSALRDSPNGQQARGAFCWMGLCQECIVVVDGIRQPACRTACRAGLVVRKGTIG